MSKIIFRMRLSSPNLVVTVDEASGAVQIASFATSFGAREYVEMFNGGPAPVVELSELVSKAYKRQQTKNQK
jgi:hypothetical protein